MNPIVRARLTTRPAALAALAGPALGRLGAGLVGNGSQVMEAAAAFCRIPKFRPSSQTKTKAKDIA